MIPFSRDIFVGGTRANFRQIGRHWADTLVATGLEPQHRVLDVGCGIGRIALGLTDHLTSGSYEGFDIVRSGIDWCKANITSRHPAFQFQHVDVFNRHYNPAGTVPPARFRFPYRDAEFDFAFLTSVVTHMLRDDAVNYIAELGRVLKGGGTSVGSWFLLNDESTNFLRSGQAAPDRHFRYEVGECLTAHPEMPERGVAYPEQVVRQMYAAGGLRIAHIQHGAWAGRSGARHSQDIVVAVK